MKLVSVLGSEEEEDEDVEEDDDAIAGVGV